MLKIVIVCAFLSVGALARAADLTPVESRWLRGLWPVVRYAQGIGAPLRIVVQPQPTPGHAPLALGWTAERGCQLVLSMRGNAEAQATLDRMPPALTDAALELMAAHELAHCRRNLDGAWLRGPAGFTGHAPDGLPATLRADWLAMQAQRREEAYADLVGLAWIQARRPAEYPAVHAWLVAERRREAHPGDHHDTLAWIEAARDGRVFASAEDAEPLFAAAARVWRARLVED